MKTKRRILVTAIGVISLFASFFAGSRYASNVYGYLGHFDQYIKPRMNQTLLPDRYLIFQCKVGHECGGLADREKGIVSAYVISQILGVRFGIDSDKPCELSQYLTPNVVQWIIDPKSLAGKNSETFMRIGRHKQDKMLAFENITSMFTKYVIFYRGNVDLIPILMKNPLLHQLPWTRGLGHYDIYKYVYDKLFKLAPKSQEKIDRLMKQVGKSKLICGHIRIGKSATMPNDLPRTRTAAESNTVFKFLKEKSEAENSYKIFIATDSNQMRKKIHETFADNLVDIEGELVHVNLASSGNKSCDGLEKALLDQKVLSICDVLVMSYSGFSRVAGLIRGKDEDLYEAVQKNITATKRLDPSFAQLL